MSTRRTFTSSASTSAEPARRPGDGDLFPGGLRPPGPSIPVPPPGTGGLLRRWLELSRLRWTRPRAARFNPVPQCAWQHGRERVRYCHSRGRRRRQRIGGESDGNCRAAVTLSEVCIEGLKSTPSRSGHASGRDRGVRFGKRVHAGPVGAVMDFSRMVGDHDEYRGNALSILLLAKYGKANASDAVLAWAENRTGSLGSLVAQYPWSDPPRDAMDHVMKGSIGLFFRTWTRLRSQTRWCATCCGGAPGVEAIPWRGPGRCAGERGQERYGERK